MPLSEPAPSNRVTALLIGRLGDLVVATPMLRALKARYPGTALRLVTSPLCEEAARLVPSVDEVLVLRRAHALAANAALAVRLLKDPSDLLVDLNPSPSRSSAALARLARSPEKLGFAKGRLDSAFTRRVAAAGEREHMLDRYARLAAALAAPYDPVPELRLRPEHEKGAEELLGLAGARPGTLKLLIHPGNFKKFDNRWPEERFIELSDRLMQDGSLSLLYMAGPGEEAPVRAIVSRLKRPVPVLGPAPLGVVGALMRRMDLCLMNITGTTHLAGAVGAATLGLYSGYTDAVWRLRGPRHSGVVSASWSSCRGIPVDEVLAAVSAALARR